MNIAPPGLVPEAPLPNQNSWKDSYQFMPHYYLDHPLQHHCLQHRNCQASWPFGSYSPVKNRAVTQTSISSNVYSNSCYSHRIFLLFRPHSFSYYCMHHYNQHHVISVHGPMPKSFTSCFCRAAACKHYHHGPWSKRRPDSPDLDHWQNAFTSSSWRK